MKKVWILERFINSDEMTESLNELCKMRDEMLDHEDIKTCEKAIANYKKRMEKHPDGYWLGYQGKINYREFCRCAQSTMRNLKGSQFRVVKAEIEDNAMRWTDYKNPEQNDGVLRYLYATL